MFDLELFFEVFIKHRSFRFIFYLLCLVLLLFILKLFCNIQLTSLTFLFWSNHQDVLKSNYDGVVVGKLLVYFKLFSQKVSILLDHLVYHLLYHTKVDHDVVLSKTLTFLHLLKLPRCFIVNKSEDFFNGVLNRVDLLDRCFVFLQISFILFFILLNSFFEFFLKFLPFVILSKTLVFVESYLIFYFQNLRVKVFCLFRKLLHKLREGEVSFFRFNEVGDEFVDILCSCSLSNTVEAFSVLLELVFRDHTLNFLIGEAPESLLLLSLHVDFFLSLCFLVQSLKFCLLAFFRLHELLHLLFLFDAAVNKRHLLVEVCLFLFGLLYQLCQFFCCCLSVFVSRLGDLHNILHLFLLQGEVVGQLGIDLLEN